MENTSDLIPPHGGYSKLVTYKLGSTQLRQVMAVWVSDLSDKIAIKQEVAANTMICLINQETFLLGRQIARLAKDFEDEGGFTERLYKIRSEKRNK